MSEGVLAGGDISCPFLDFVKSSALFMQNFMDLSCSVFIIYIYNHRIGSQLPKYQVNLN